MNALWGLMENRLEELKILQTIMVLVSRMDCVHGELLAKVFVSCNWLIILCTLRNSGSFLSRRLSSAFGCTWGGIL